jgi:hypothetical protein
MTLAKKRCKMLSATRNDLTDSLEQAERTAVLHHNSYKSFHQGAATQGLYNLRRGSLFWSFLKQVGTSRKAGAKKCKEE